MIQPELCSLMVETENIDYVIFAMVKNRVGDDMEFFNQSFLHLIEDALNVYIAQEADEEDCLGLLSSYLEASKSKEPDKVLAMAENTLAKMREDSKEVFVYTAYFNLVGRIQATSVQKKISNDRG